MTPFTENLERPHTRAIARGRAYDLLAHGLRFGLTQERLPHFASVPALAEWVPSEEEFDPDEAAAQLQRVFAMELVPHASVFLSADGLMGGGPTEAIRAAAGQVGFSGLPKDLEPDHVSVSLSILRWLCGAEADAWRDGQETTARALQETIAQFMDAHPLRWFDALAVSLITCPGADPFLRQLTQLASELVRTHRAELKPICTIDPLPPAPSLMGDPKTDLRRIARVLTTPALAGGYLTGSSIRQLGRTHRLPQGFGARALTLTNLMHSAAQFDRLLVLIDGFIDIATAWTSQHQDEAWRSRAQHTCEWLQQMRDTAAQSTDS